MTNEIEISLFDTLDKVSDLLADRKIEEDEEKLVLKMHEVETNLETFIGNFFLQLFNYGFGLEIEGVTEEDCSYVKSHLSDSKDSPENIIASFEEAIEIMEAIETAVYLDPPRDGDLYDAYMSFLPKLFESFKKDESVLRQRIDNYGRVRVRMEGILVRIGELKEQRTLS